MISTCWREVSASPVLVSGVYSLLTAAWEAATDLEAYLRGEVPELAPEAREILRVLGAGLTDEAAAGYLFAHLPAAGRRVDGCARGRLPLPGRSASWRAWPGPLTRPSVSELRPGKLSSSNRASNQAASRWNARSTS